MNRLHVLCLGIFFSLAVAGLPMLSHAFQTAKKEKPEEFSLKTGSGSAGGEQVYETRFIEEQVLNADGQEKILIVLEVRFYTGYSFAANADSTVRTVRYTLQRVGAPDKAGSYPVFTWKLIKTEGKDLLKGRLQKTMKMTLRPRRNIILQFSDKDSIRLDSELTRTDPYDDW